VQQMLAMKSERDDMVATNNRLEQRIIDLRDDFESRLNRYVKDIAVWTLLYTTHTLVFRL
jgi:hypothetical protein